VATKRRKGEKPVVHEPLVWSETCIVANMIRTGDRWFYSWTMQQSARHLHRTGIASERLTELDRGAMPTDDELEKLAVPFRTDTGSLKASIEFERSMKGEPRHGL
jgi:hypothetical protein